jgi:signal transduction histidine kinase/DNA-binding NarL/FixJ family response regulator
LIPDPGLPGIGVIDPRTTPLVALLVEDDPPDAELIAVRLEPGRQVAGSTPVRIIHRATAATACAALRYWTVDVVILDLTLPDARGLEALHRIRAAAPGTPVIVISGIADQALAVEALRAGAQDYVMKPPPDGQTLTRILRYAVERQRLMRTVDDALRTSAIAARQWKMLAEVSKALAASSYSPAAIPEVARLCVPDIADCFVLFLGSDEDEPFPAAIWHTNGEKADELKIAIESFLAGPESSANGLLDSLRTDDATTSALWDSSLMSVYGSLDLASGTAVPLRFGGRVRGLLVLAFMPGRRDPVADVEFTRSVAYRISMALEQQRLLRQTQRAVTARDRALSIVSHDLRNPLSTIEICALALLDPAPAPQSGIHEMGELIQRSASWMQQIVEDLLDRASLDAGRLALHRRPTSVAELLDATRLMFSASAAQRMIDLVLTAGAGLPLIDVDPHRLLQVLSNLISNAMKFTPSGGRVQLFAQAVEDDLSEALLKGARGPAVRFTVSDTGSGISSDDLRHIFDWYWQSPKGPRKGAGLGLAIAKGLLEAHSSRLNVDSVPGTGSSFWFTVPAANGHGLTA